MTMTDIDPDFSDLISRVEAAEAVEPSRLDQLRSALVDTDGLDNIPEPEPLVPGLLYKDSSTWVFGSPGCGKSFFAIDLAGCVATGTSFHGFSPVKSGVVLYLVAEGVTGIKRRVRAWEGSYQQKMAGVKFLPVAVQASNASEWNAFVELATELSPALIVVDTQARVTVGMDENSNTEMGAFVHRVDQLRLATGACTLVVHHTGRNGEHMRGAIAIDGAADTIIKVSKDEDVIKIENTKQKNAEEFDAFKLRLISYELSAILSLMDPTSSASLESHAMRTLLTDWWNTHETREVSASVLFESGVVTKPTFYRHIKSLVNAGAVQERGNASSKRFWMTSKPL